jgi:hypothetical protein
MGTAGRKCVRARGAAAIFAPAPAALGAVSAAAAGAGPEADQRQFGLRHLQAQIIAYIDDFEQLKILTLLALPLVFFFKKLCGEDRADHALVE